MDDDGRLIATPNTQRANRSEARFRYQYDSYDNWIEKIVEARGQPGQDFIVSTIERRTITYFDEGYRRPDYDGSTDEADKS